jgi:hypothetical protein
MLLNLVPEVKGHASVLLPSICKLPQRNGPCVPWASESLHLMTKEDAGIVSHYLTPHSQNPWLEGH